MAMKTRYTVIDGEILSQTKNGARHHYVPDPSGNVVALFDSSGTKTDTFDYFPYGEQQSRTGTTETPFRFGGAVGYHRDTDRWTYVRARHYRPDHGRWLTADPLGPKLQSNLYSYARASPITALDPSGLQSVVDFPPSRPYYPPSSGGSSSPGSGSSGGITWPAIGFAYGQCCGPQRRCNEHSNPEDCIDASCMRHDVCVSSLDAWCQRGKECDRNLCVSALGCLVAGCRNAKSTTRCKQAAAQIAIAFCTIGMLTFPFLPRMKIRFPIFFGYGIRLR